MNPTSTLRMALSCSAATTGVFTLGTSHKRQWQQVLAASGLAGWVDDVRQFRSWNTGSEFPQSKKSGCYFFALVSNFAEAKRQTSRPLTNQNDTGMLMTSRSSNFTRWHFNSTLECPLDNLKRCSVNWLGLRRGRTNYREPIDPGQLLYSP